ncbi:MAG: response regulator transcription factor [Candidatus Gastranaerophilales bacterium]|nr:response regulator transcription factor [Candidatus Gastranaerophilales bacterium]
MTNRVLIVDDDQQIMDWLYLDLQLSGFSVDCASDGLNGLQKARQNHYDLLILDVMMPKMDGYEVCKNIRKTNKELPIILLTAKGTIEDKITGFNHGADDYLVKPFDIQELLVRMRALLRRSYPQEQELNEVLESGDIKLFPDSLEVQIKNKLIKLTPTEFEILYCLLQHVNQAVKLNTLLKEVWGYDSDEDVRMVRVHMGGLRQKIEVNPKTPKYVQTITNIGYKLVPFLDEQINSESN